MSIVLDALEKIEKEKSKLTQIQDSVSNSEQNTEAAVIGKKEPEELIVLSIENPPSKKETTLQQDKKLPLEIGKIQTKVKPKITKGSKYSRRLLILTAFSFTVTTALIFYNYYSNKKDINPEIIPNKTVNIIPELTEIPVTPPSKISAIKDILLDNNPPQLKVTGVVWDEIEPIILVNSRFLKQGDEILGVKVVKIEPTKATFLYNNNEFTISIE